MRMPFSLRTPAYLSAYGALFLCSFWVPFKWGPQLTPTRRVAEATRTSELCGLAIVAPPRLPPAAPEDVVPWNGEISDQVLLRWDAPLPPLARQWDAAASPAPIPEIACEEPRIALAPAPRDDAPLSLPALEVDTPPTLPADGMSGVWPRPLSLLDLLKKLSEHPDAAGWAARVSDAIEQLTSDTPLETPQRTELVQQLRDAVAEMEPLAAAIGEPTTARQLRRAGFGLVRRLDLWQAAAAVDQRKMQEGTARDSRSLVQCMSEVKQLVQGTSGEGWRNYLMLESLHQLSEARPAALSADQRTLARRVLDRLDHARQLPDQQRFVAQGPLAVLDAELRRLALEPIDTSRMLAALELYETTGRASVGRDVAEDLQRLAYSPHEEDQALARRVEEHYRNCNVRMAVHRDMLTRFLPAQQPREAPVRDVILGVPVRGRSTTTNELAVKLLPHSQRLQLELSAHGFVQSTTTSQRGSVAFNSSSESTYLARKVVELGGRKIESQPAMAEAQTTNRLRSVKSDFDNVPLIGSIVQDYAKDRYRDRREAARQEAQAKVASQASQRLDELAEEGLGKAHQRFLNQVVNPLDRMGLAPSYSENRTDETRLTLRTRLATRQQMAANTPRPQALSDSLLSAQVHESAANNILASMGLAGKRFTAEELRQHLIETFNRTRPIEPSSADDYIVTFAESDPLRVRFHEGRFELAVSIAQLESGTRSWQNFTVYANFKPQKAGAGVELVREGPIGLDGERLGMQSQFVLRGTFGRIFSEERRITWIADWLRDDQRLSGLQVTQCEIQDGWLGLSIGPQRAE